MGDFQDLCWPNNQKYLQTCDKSLNCTSAHHFAKSHWQLYWYWIPDRQRRLMLDTCTLYISSSNKLDEESWRDQMDCWKINKFISWLTLFDFWEKGRKVCSRKYNKSSLLHLKLPHTLNTPNKVQITWFELQWNVCSAQTNCGKSYKLTWDGSSKLKIK